MKTYSEVWDSLEIGESITTKDLILRTGDPRKNTASAYLSSMKKRGYAIIEGEKQPHPYKKISPDDKPDEISVVQLGLSILSVIKKLEAKNKELCIEVKDLVEETSHKDKTIRLLQERVSDLNSEGASKSFNLSTIQDLVKGG